MRIKAACLHWNLSGSRFQTERSQGRRRRAVLWLPTRVTVPSTPLVTLNTEQTNQSSDVCCPYYYDPWLIWCATHFTMRLCRDRVWLAPSIDLKYTGLLHTAPTWCGSLAFWSVIPITFNRVNHLRNDISWRCVATIRPHCWGWTFIILVAVWRHVILGNPYPANRAEILGYKRHWFQRLYPDLLI